MKHAIGILFTLMVACGSDDNGEGSPTAKQTLATIQDGDSDNSQGAKGDKGDQGIQGEQGERGEKGEKGEKGDSGEEGEKGDQGIEGAAGQDGEQGIQGAAGADGAAGAQGAAGIAGAKGDKGDAGNDGAAGAAGTTGATGAAGAAGAAGTAGYFKVYSSSGTALGLYVDLVTIPHQQYANVDGYAEIDVYGIVMRKLNANEYTVYKTSISVSGNSTTPDNRNYFYPDPQQLQMYGSGNNVYYSGANCTGTSVIRYSSSAYDGNGATQLSTAYFSLMSSFPNLFLRDSSASLEVKITPQGTSGNSVTNSYLNGSGTCSNTSQAATSWVQATARTPGFPASLGTGWYIDN